MRLISRKTSKVEIGISAYLFWLWSKNDWQLSTHPLERVFAQQIWVPMMTIRPPRFAWVWATPVQATLKCMDFLFTFLLRPFLVLSTNLLLLLTIIFIY